MDVILKPTEKELETLTKVAKITGVDYDGKQWHQDLTIDNLIEALSDMVRCYRDIEEELKDKESYCHEWHVEKEFDPYEEYGVSRSDFY
jgi:hypothetical protein